MGKMERDEGEFLDAQAALYRELGQALFDMMDPAYQHDWDEILLEVDQPPDSDGTKQTFRIALTLMDGLTLPLIARPNVIELCRRLDLLTRARFKGSSWQSFRYRFHHGQTGPAFECSYTYPEVVH